MRQLISKTNPVLFIALAAALGVACGDDDGGSSDGGTNDNDGGVPIECGNGSQEGLEQCDDGLSNSDTVPNACRTDCTLPSCGDGVTDDDDECDDGILNSDTGPDACRSDCSLPSCGDDVIDPDSSEACDDGAANSDAPGASCRLNCQVAGCGDGILDVGEECDEGLANSDVAADACRTTCLDPYCGDGTVDTGEICDDANSDSGDGCSGDCLSDESCGNQFVDIAAGEQCDDGNHLSHDGCSSGCTAEPPIWIQRTPTTRPTARIRHSMVYDSTRERTLLFGGWTPGQYFADTHSYNGNNWMSIFAATPPPSRHSAAMAYDRVRDRVVLFGGFYSSGAGGDVYRGDTWEYNGVNWGQRFPSVSPPARSEAGMVYDPVRGTVVLFGGMADHMDQDFGDTWEWDGTNWTEITGSGPPTRTNPGMVWDAARNRIVLFGGTDLDWAWPTQTPLNDTWEFDGTSWQLVTTTNSPPVRSSCPMAYDANRGVTVLFGGNESQHDTWEYDGTDWTEIIPAASPGGRGYHAMTYDRVRRRTVIFGGIPESLMGHLDETWEYWLASTWPDEQCDNATDDDSDGDVDCADPDCEGLSCATGTCTGGVCQ